MARDGAPAFPELGRKELYWLFAAGVLLGAGAMASICGFLVTSEVLQWGFPASLLLAAAGRRLLAL
jgi:hypothetical protein